ncbi:Bor/Iss family lipoprotein [Oleiphilus sp. HI0117]|uniref:Bor/Iss family lipoprotein n=1 Tax=Oleiphilus sp. HI0117 TaxID=1822261 RepID=UPI0007C2DD35|nr:hypothetical protein [Oleiphilus sp. HI0117]KZZ40231.1 hypothetical protein A3757_21720 [Oleiphilus sp. HI0117]
MSKISTLFVLFLAISLGGCAAVTITESGPSDFRYRPHYEESKHFFLWGFIGEHHIDVTKICRQQPVKQMQSKYSATDVLFATLSRLIPPQNCESLV